MKASAIPINWFSDVFNNSKHSNQHLLFCKSIISKDIMNNIKSTPSIKSVLLNNTYMRAAELNKSNL